VPVPAFISALRSRIGHDPLWLAGVTAVVRDGDGRVLLTRRSDTGAWALPSGIPEPGEHLGQAVAREVAEETGVEVVVERLVSLMTLPPMAYPNGDRCQFVDHAFACRATGGSARVADDESLEVAWVARGELPDLAGWQRDVLALADGPADAPAWFAR
jgi:8-oxo-dGTP pyrophosphatase MutT (NUDIX family)